MPKPSKPSKVSSSDHPPVEQLTYEQAFAELESIVSTLESSVHSLENALDLFERGRELARYCAALLDQAELKVQQITGEDLTDFDVPAT